MSEATIEVDGEVYALTHAAIRDNTQTYTGSRGEQYTMRIGPEWLAVQVSAESWDFPKRFSDGPFPCRVNVPGRPPVTGTVRVMGIAAGLVSLHVHDLKPISATPVLDETTDPADLDWGAIRSACDRRDWREAWGAVGTDHAGDATPGEVYLLSVARHKSATAAALRAWLACALPTFTMLGRPAVAPAIHKMQARAVAENAGWQRIKRIAAWESSARAQYVKPTEKTKRALAWIEAIERGMVSTPHMVGGPFGGSAMRAVIDDPVVDWAQQVRLYGRDNAGDELLNALRQIERATQAADTTVRPTDMWIDEATLDALLDNDPMLHGDGRGVVGVLNNPFLTAAAQRGEITGTMTFRQGGEQLMARYGVTAEAPITPPQQIATNVLRNAPRAANPAPRGPQTGRRRR